MDFDEQRLRDEVIFLHSLWRQGPPINPNPRPISNPSSFLHKTFSPTTFKNPTAAQKRKNKAKKIKRQPESCPSPGAEWPVQPIPQKPSGWLKPQSAPATRPATAEEEAKLIALQLQENGLAACKAFASKADSDEDDGDDGDDDDDDDDLEEDGCEEFEFFVGLFAKDAELRTYYEKNNEGGVFCCLVCCGMGKKIGKRFKDCVGLVQHSIAISKTNKRRAHRAYGRVVCRILGWDVNRLPMIVIKGNSNGNVLDSGSADLKPNGHTKDQNVDIDEVKGDNSDSADDNLYVVVKDSATDGVVKIPRFLRNGSLEEGNNIKFGERVLDATDVNGGVRDCTVPKKEECVEPGSKDSDSEQARMIVSDGANGGTSEVNAQQ